MALSNKEVKDLIRHPYSAGNLARARYQESRLKFHSQIVENKAYASPYYSEYLTWVSNILTAKDKRGQFENLLTFPVPTNDVIDTIADEYAKVFNSQNSYIGIEFSDPTAKTQYYQYMEDCNDKEFWTKTVFNAMFGAINSIMVVDLEVEQDEEVPEPYCYLLDINRVIDVKVDHEGEIEYLIFSEGHDKIIVLDEYSYRVFYKRGDNFTLKLSNPHTLGYTPARFMWSDNLSQENQIIKQSPISSLLSRLDWFLFLSISKECLDIYASFPIYWHFENKCEIPKCNGGFIPYVMADGVSQGLQRCPACEKNSLVGAGSVLAVPPPRSSDSPDLRNPVGVVPAETESLKYNVDEVERIEAKIVEIATGKLSEKYRTTGAINEDQVHSNYESQTNILRYIAQNFESAHAWVIETTAKLMFGDKYLNCIVNYGTEFYLQTQNDVVKEYTESNDAGLPMYILQAKRNQIDELQSKNNPKERERLLILRQLEPFQDSSLDSLQTLGVPEKYPLEFAIKINFATFVNRFEREHGNIVEWGSALNFNTKIERINSVFKTYGKEAINNTGVE